MFFFLMPVLTKCSTVFVRNILLFFAVQIAVVIDGERCTRNSIDVGQVINGLLASYDRHLLPYPDGVHVTVEIHVQEISSLSELTSDFDLDIMYSEIWEDPRLSFQHMNICTTNITLKARFRKQIWTPDTCIINSKRAEIHSSPSENTFVLLYEQGRIWANYRMKVKAPCRLDLSIFPFDTQRCQLVFESYSFNAEEVRLHWHHTPITLIEPMDLPDFLLAGYHAGFERLEYPNGIWDRLNVTFMFSRRYQFYLFQAYFPTCLTVVRLVLLYVSSWVGFMLDTKSTSARITLGVSSLLALTFQFGTVLRHLPRVSYIKCLDVWMIACVIFIFCTLVQLAIVCQLSRRERERQVGTQIITQWLQTVKKRRAAGSQPENGELGELPNENQRHIVSRSDKRRRSSRSHSRVKWRSFVNRVINENQTESNHANYQTFSTPSETDRLILDSATGGSFTVMNRSEGDKPIYSSVGACCCGGIKGITNVYRRCKEVLANCKITAVNADRGAVVLFPLAFLIFNAAYWSYYLYYINKTAKNWVHLTQGEVNTQH